MSSKQKLIYLPTNERLDMDFNPKKRDDNSDGGGGDMSNYVTKEEFNSAIKDLSHQIELNQEKILSKFDNMSDKVDFISQSVPDKIQLALNEKEKEQLKEARETKRYVIGTLILGIVSIVISLFF